MAPAVTAIGARIITPWIKYLKIFLTLLLLPTGDNSFMEAVCAKVLNEHVFGGTKKMLMV